MEINRMTPQDGPQGLKGSMKLANASLGQDVFTLSDSPDRGFLQSMKEKIKNLFTGNKESDAKPAKEPGAYYAKPDGTTEWYTQTNPPPPKDAYGHWVIDTACGACDWYWCKSTEPAAGPTYGPAYVPPGGTAPASEPAPPPPEAADASKGQ